MADNRKRGGSRSNNPGKGGSRRDQRTGRLQRDGRDQQHDRSQAQSARPQRNRDNAQVPKGEFIEGRRAAAEALRTGFPIKCALIAEGGERDAALSRLVDDLNAAGVRIKYVPRAQLDALSSHGAHQGIALEVGNFPYADVVDILDRAGEGPALVVVLDHVTDDGNFGAIVRSAEVVGAAGVIIANKRAAGVTVGSYKTSAGAVMHLPIAQVPNIARALDDLKAAGFWVGGASEHAEGSCWDAPFEGRVALVMGSEGDGISRLVLEKCDFLTKLPQRGMTESLNVAQATTALCFEWLRRNAGELMGEE
mgnify:FL=1